MAFSVRGKSAIVTGAGSGINLCFVKRLLENGCNCLIADLGLRPEAQTLVEKHSVKSENSAHAVFHKTDVTDWTQLTEMFAVAKKQFGEIDIVCPGAGVYEPSWSNFWTPPGAPGSKDSPSGGRYATIDINLVHPIRTTQIALSHFIGAKTPKHILHVSSIAGQEANLPVPIYSATKHAVNGFVRSLADLDSKLGIRVTAIAPGIIKTPLWTDNPEKMKMLGGGDIDWVTPEQVADVMLATIQQDEVSSQHDSNDGPMIPIKGGIILEVSKRIRSVMPFNDPGPGVKENVAGMGAAESVVWDSLSQKGWGKSSETDE